MPPSNSDERDEDEPSDPVADDDSMRRGSGVRLGIGLRPVTDVLKGLVDAGASNPPPEPDEGRDGDRQRRTDGEPTPRWSKPIRAHRERARAETDETRHESDVDSYYVTAHRADDEVTVVADLPGVSEDDLSVGLARDSNEFVIAVRGAVVRRVSLPWNRAAVDKARFNNAVLEVRLRPPGDAGGSVET
ncbi:gas vesicle protein GvpH [Haladaptatus salinisoli]|uniref:gas vesicle protein GvpH n=1 Tax=Haladaptatus salinisoli TaxID=2884876 RepID=UPI001D09AC30|nr:gas vesicle protein GvpH [Haladaptatus salinisoli]